MEQYVFKKAKYINKESSYSEIIKFLNEYIGYFDDILLLDFSKVKFISANLFALLGACINYLYVNNRLEINVYGINDKLMTIMQKNGFHRHLSWPQINDIHKTTIPYRIFSATTDALVEFEKYLLINLFTHSGLPVMSPALKNQIIDNLLEMFNNVIDHTMAKEVYVCGQVFPNKCKLYFSIVDTGTTIKENVTSYSALKKVPVPQHCISWATVGGNTTMISNEPGGMGLSILSDFISENNGAIYIISDDEYYELFEGKVNTKNIENRFIGTVVTICINLNDNNVYLIDDSNSLIYF